MYLFPFKSFTYSHRNFNAKSKTNEIKSINFKEVVEIKTKSIKNDDDFIEIFQGILPEMKIFKDMEIVDEYYSLKEINTEVLKGLSMVF